MAIVEEPRVANASDRYYDPLTAQFTTPDPLFALTGSRYGYAGNDPINGEDPMGLCSLNPFGSGNCYTSVAHTAEHVGHDIAAAPGHVAHDVYAHRKGIAQGFAYVMSGVAVGACIAASAGVCAVAVAGGVAARSISRQQDVGFGNSWKADLVDAAFSATLTGLGSMADAGAEATIAKDIAEGDVEGLHPWLRKLLMSGPDAAMLAADLLTRRDALADAFDSGPCA